MILTFYNVKGGVGKTSLAANFALTEKFAIVTNDIYSPLHRILDDKKFIKVTPGKPFPTIPDKYNVIYDLGGYLDNRVVDVLKVSKWVVVPVINDITPIQGTIDAVHEIQNHTKNILIVVNQAEKGDLEAVEKIMSEFFKYPVIEIKKSKGFSNVFKQKKSLAAMVAEGGLKKYSYSKIEKQFDDLIKYLKN